jgi:hypothetical protein
VDETILEASQEAHEGDLDLGAFLGRQEAFGLISGRCSAAQAMCLREIYEKQLYKTRCSDWDRFCRDYLHMSRTHVQKIIKLLNEFGPEYFELSQLTRVSAETYRAIRPALEGNSLHVNGESIELIPANAARVSTAVASLRKAARPRQPEPARLSHKQRLAILKQHCAEIVAEFESLVESRHDLHELAAALVSLQTGLDRVQVQI